MSMGSINENIMRVNVEQEIKELPGQMETFVGKPMLQKHYHQIVPSESRGEDRHKKQKGPLITKSHLARMANDSNFYDGTYDSASMPGKQKKASAVVSEISSPIRGNYRNDGGSMNSEQERKNIKEI